LAEYLISFDLIVGGATGRIDASWPFFSDVQPIWDKLHATESKISVPI
jgi:hypothetical protein